MGRRKRSRTDDASPDADTDKRRGRPRVDKQDENAADVHPLSLLQHFAVREESKLTASQQQRRRTQIRMAQRAYRQRKESTLEELRKRVADLSATVELMNRQFADFTARMLATDLTDAQAAELEGTSLRFDALVKEARNPGDELASASSALAMSATTTAPVASIAINDQEAAVSTSFPQVRNVPSWLDQSAVSSMANRPGPSPADLGMGYSLFTSNADDEATTLAPTRDIVPFRPISPTPASSPDKITFTNAFFDDDLPPFPIPSPQPSPPQTFSFQESTFARRLQRSCLERAYQLLLEPDTRPATYERVFRLSLLGRSRAKVLNAIRIVLSRGPHQELDFWEAPMIHVGGAGTHYPPRDAFGNLLPRRSARNVGKIGPQTLALLDNVSREQCNADLTVEIVGYEGEWFDPGDVQGYLEEKGVFIEPSATFVEVDWAVGDDEGSSSAARARSPLELSAGTDVDVAQWADDVFADVGFTNVGFSDAQTGSFFNFLQPGEAIKRTTGAGELASWPEEPWMGDASVLSTAMEPSRRPRTEKTVIDVRKLIKALSTSGVCLSRTPGFRRRDVDLALRLATVDAASF